MNPLKLENPAQSILTGIFSFAVAAILNRLLKAAPGEISYISFIAVIIVFLFSIGYVIRFGHYIDFLMSPERRMRGLYVEYFFDGKTPRLSISRMHYSTKARRFAVNGISFYSPDPKKLMFHAHSRWDSTGVVPRYVDNEIAGIFYPYRSNHFVGRKSRSPGYTWHNVSNASEWTGYFSDIDAPVHRRTDFLVGKLKVKSGHPAWFDTIFSPDGNMFAGFSKNEAKGAELLNEVLGLSPASESAGSFELPPGLTTWLRTITIPAKTTSDTADKESVVENLLQLSQNAYADYTQFKVSCCVRSASGRIYSGVNCENASSPQGLCAEAVAVGAMISAGERKIAEVYLHSPNGLDIVPCGGCLQKLLEFATAETQLHTVNAEKNIKSQRLADLLPQHFKLEKR
jgi:cytidine deaminase